ncbi:hypothetical protein HF324_05765 [Chitinophaga oryzae]|uniref:Uncharacterized protein n=1 Tax=Chitinophaga oryzae TaxID=2725414 RepID=A0ABX6LB90_9BACT|nr:hypothetical protein [Chitinophaga oryzae]QJB37383.1 hypothetical protein HF324_05765 [Chitinophaga oryzae]
MKKILSIWLLGIILVQSTGNCWIIAAFYLNRNRIASTLCVNRFEQIPVCRGICYLQQKLEENEHQQDRAPELKHKEVLLFFEPVTTPTLGLPPESKQPSGIYISPYFPTTHQHPVFKPPVC